MNKTRSHADWSIIPRSRLRPLDIGYTSRRRMVKIGGSVAIAAASAWWGVTLVRPLPLPLASNALTPKRVALPAFERSSADQRGALLNRLASRNWFSAHGTAWSGPLTVGAPATSEAAPALAPVAHQLESDESAARSIERVDVDPLPPAIAEALKGLELRGVHLDQHRIPVAMVGFVHAPERLRTRSVREGQQFGLPGEVEELTWRVERIDIERQRVVLSREGRFASLALFGMSARRGAATRSSAPRIVAAQESQIRADLKAAGVDEARIEGVLLAMRDPARAEVAQELEALASGGAGVSAQPEAPIDAGPPQMPPAFQELLARMARQTASSQASATPREHRD